MIFINDNTLVNEKKIVLVTNRLPAGIDIYDDNVEPCVKTDFGNCKLFAAFLEYAPKCAALDTFEEYVKRCS